MTCFVYLNIGYLKQYKSSPESIKKEDVNNRGFFILFVSPGNEITQTISLQIGQRSKLYYIIFVDKFVISSEREYLSR